MTTPADPCYQTPMRGDVRVLYVMGAGRSGSTIFDATVGSHPAMAGLGELNRMARQAWLRKEMCSCGERAVDCSFWSAIRDAWLAPGDAAIDEQVALEKSVERLPRWATRGMAARTANSSTFAAYAERAAALFHILADATGSQVIIDSSKMPARAMALAHVPGIDLRVVHLVRDPRGVAWSLRKRLERDLAAGVPKNSRIHPVWWTAAAWSLTNAQAELARRIIGPERSIFARYEDFATRPREVLERVCELVGVDPAPMAAIVNGEMDLRTRHLVAGNRLRMKGSARLSLDEAWRQKLAPGEIRTCRRVAGPLMRRYGYAA